LLDLYGMSNVAIFDIFYLYLIILHLYCIMFHLYCIIFNLYSIFSIVFYNVLFVLYNFLFVLYPRDCLFLFVTMDLIGLMYSMHIITGKRWWHHTCPLQCSNPGRPRRNLAMLPQDQRPELAGLASNHSNIPNPVTLSIVMGWSKGERVCPLGNCGAQKKTNQWTK
jgi:hypothetical protein